ncbi:hypothetical protein FBY35_3730 [Streptomyces sp. SLBN-118]|uniref:hypothetical protein n=1 Tax=Streptomyces sp. SLBN-118 TaxID=2768454 RepID=UPI00116EF355|nr:hypothetical protein [Streptomyces sp. SLBN-118]TQK42340.1 hypothetical protein FBY35_3730 [Streptomyces sp. SLBN-118]
MSRKRPGQVRAGQHLRDHLTYRPRIRGLSSAAHAEVARVETSRNHLYVGYTADAVRMWRNLVHNPYRRLWVEYEHDGCGVWQCCGSPFEARTLLEAVIVGMSRRRARELRSLVDQLDDLY